MDFFKNIKDKVNDRFFANDEDYDEDEVNGDDYADASDSEPMFEGEMNNKYSYSPTGSMQAPEYNFSKRSTTAPPEYNPAAQNISKNGNIYDMSSIRPAAKFKLNSIVLHEIYGAKEVALQLKEKDTIIIVNFTPLSENQKLRAMDFLDGAKCITNAIMAKLNENIIVFVPENVELCGDFQSQVDIDSLR